MTYFVTAPECLGILWGALNIQSTVYYPIGVVTGIELAACAALYFKKKTPTTISV